MDNIVYSLASKGLWGGNPIKIWNSPANVVMEMYHFKNFASEYEDAEYYLNTEEKTK